jgi:transcriptional regulator with XRE-family HTH domain
MPTLGSTIRQLRRSAGLTQRELAQRLGVDSTHVSHLEADRKDPSLQLIRDLASTLDIPPGLLLAVSLSTGLSIEQQKIYAPILERLISIAKGHGTDNSPDDEERS